MGGGIKETVDILDSKMVKNVSRKSFSSVKKGLGEEFTF